MQLLRKSDRQPVTLSAANIIGVGGEARVFRIAGEEKVAKVYPFAKAISGKFGLHARLAPAREPNPLEPLRLDVALDASPGATYGKTVELGDGRFRVYLNLDPHWGLVRAVMADEKEPDMPPVERPGSQSQPIPRPPRMPALQLPLSAPHGPEPRGRRSRGPLSWLRHRRRKRIEHPRDGHCPHNARGYGLLPGAGPRDRYGLPVPGR